MDEIVYFTRRAVDKGKIVCWVFKALCTKCKKGLMAKPRDPKTGKPKIRAKEYVCPACNYTVEKEAYEDTLMANVEYTCPSCEYVGEIVTSFKRKSYQGVKAIVFECQKCKVKIPITKKMKAVGEKDDDEAAAEE